MQKSVLFLLFCVSSSSSSASSLELYKEYTHGLSLSLYNGFYVTVHGWVGFDSLSLVEKLDDLRIWDLFVWLLSELGIRVLEFLFGNSIDGLEIGEKGY